MTDHDPQQGILELIAARLALEAADQCIQRSYIAYGKVSQPTVLNVLRAKNHKLSTLIAIADALDCDVEITITRRTA